LDGVLPAKADRRLSADALATAARVNARDAALRVVTDGLRLVIGAGGASAGDVRTLEATVGMPAVLAAQAGLIEDMDRVADALYGRQSA
ncbi:MAG: hypothetical protein WAS51_02740, partial [Ilumatobacteraceae bacterium]